MITEQRTVEIVSNGDGTCRKVDSVSAIRNADSAEEVLAATRQLARDIAAAPEATARALVEAVMADARDDTHATPLSSDELEAKLLRAMADSATQGNDLDDLEAASAVIDASQSVADSVVALVRAAVAYARLYESFRATA